MSVTPEQRRRGPGGAEPNATVTSRAWKAMNCADTRVTIDDDEVYFLENAMIVGRGIASVPLYNGPAGAAIHGGSLVKECLGGSLTYGSNTAPHAVSIWVFEDGSAWMRDHDLDGAVDTQIAPVGTFSASPNGTGIAFWQDGPVLFIDDTAGYAKWDGTTFTVLDSSKAGPKLAVFEGHVWLRTAPRTITYTAPNSYTDFAAASGAGSFRITDEAFVGAITELFSTVEQLWLLGPSAIDALGNVATSGGVTTFSVVNAINTLGTIYGNSVSGYFRSLSFATGYSIHSLLGVTPQELSGKISRAFPQLAPLTTPGPRSGVTRLNGKDVLVTLYQFTDPVTGAARSELIGFEEGRWFFARTPDLGGNAIRDIVTLTIRGYPEVYGIDTGGFVYRLFARSTDAQKGTATVSSKLYDLGRPVTGHEGKWIGVDVSGPVGTGAPPLTVTLTTEATTTALGAHALTMFPARDTFLGQRYGMFRAQAPIMGQRLGWTLSWNCADGLTLEAVHMQHAEMSEWDVVAAPLQSFTFANPDGSAFTFVNA